MFRILLSVIVGGLVGVGLGLVQSAIANAFSEERFGGSRTTLAELRGEKTRDEVQQQSTGAPKVQVVGGTEFRFGTMQHGASMTHDFVFRNAGDGPLNLDMGGSTCKCTVGELQSSILQPGEETIVTLTWTAQSIMPEYGQTATILTNDPSSPEVRLMVLGQIADSFVVEPSSLALGDFSVTEEIDRTFHVFTYLEKSKELGEFVWTDEKTRDLVKISVNKLDLDSAKFPEHPSAHAVHQVDVHIQPGLPLGQLDSRITFTTDQGEKVGNIDVPVSGRVTGDLTFFGGASFDPKLNLLNIGSVKSSEGASVDIFLAAHGEHGKDVELEVESIKPEDALRVTIGEPKISGERKLFKLHFEVPKGAPEIYYAGSNPKDFGKVVLKTNHDFIKQVSIYIRMNVVK